MNRVLHAVIEHLVLPVLHAVGVRIEYCVLHDEFRRSDFCGKCRRSRELADETLDRSGRGAESHSRAVPMINAKPLQPARVVSRPRRPRAVESGDREGEGATGAPHAPTLPFAAPPDVRVARRKV